MKSLQSLLVVWLGVGEGVVVKSLYLQKEKNEELKEENDSHVYTIHVTQAREGSDPNADDHLGHESVTAVSHRRHDQVLFLSY